MDIQFHVSGKPVNAYLAIPPEGTGPGVLVLHAWWGLKPFFKELCKRLAQQGFVALAPDLNNGNIATTIDEAKALLEVRNFKLMYETVMAAKDYLLAHPARTGEKIGAMGFSMGGAWSLAAATAAPNQFAAVVVFYGSEGVDFGKMKAKFLGHYSDVDEWEPLEDIRAMEKDMKAAGVSATFHVYPGVGHWFVEDDRPEFDAAAASLAWERTFEFLKEIL